MATTSLSPLPSTHPDAGTPPSRPGNLRYLELTEQLAHWMDNRYVDPLIGFLLPGVGDAIGAGIGLVGVYAAFRMRAHPIVIARMLINLAVDSAVGAIPFVGAVADIFYRSHTRNLKLLRSRDPRQPRSSDWITVGIAALILLFAMALPILIVGGILVALL